MFAGCLPALAQIPFFTVMYRLFHLHGGRWSRERAARRHAVRCSAGRAFLAALAGGNVVVFLGLFALLGVVAWSSSRWQAKQAQGPAPVRLVPYGTVLMVSVIPLAAGRYLLVTNAWTMAERVVFYA